MSLSSPDEPVSPTFLSSWTPPTLLRDINTESAAASLLYPLSSDTTSQSNNVPPTPSQIPRLPLEEYAYDLAHLQCLPLFTLDISLPHLDLEREVRVLEAGLSEVKKRIRFLTSHGTVHVLTRCLPLGCRIIHFSGHAQRLRDHVAAGLFYLEDDRYPGHSFCCTVQQLSALIRSGVDAGNSPPQLAVLSACHSEVFAQAFLAAGIPFVIVVNQRDKLADKDALTFFNALYYNLFRGSQLQSAFDLAASCIPNDTPDAKIFILYNSNPTNIALFPQLPDGTCIRQSTEQVHNLPSRSPNAIARVVKRKAAIVQHLARSRYETGSIVTVIGENSADRSDAVIAAAQYLSWRLYNGRAMYDAIVYIELKLIGRDESIEAIFNKALSTLPSTAARCNQFSDLTHKHNYLFIFDGAEYVLVAPSVPSSPQSLHTFISRLFNSASGCSVLVTSLDAIKTVGTLSGIQENEIYLDRIPKTKDSAEKSDNGNDRNVPSPADLQRAASQRRAYREWNVRQQAPTYIKRSNLSTDIRTALSSLQSVIVLVGGAGVGKSCAAIDCIRSGHPTSKKGYSLTAWFNASDMNRLQSEYSAFATAVQPDIDIRDIPLVIRTVKLWFKEYFDWLIIYDGVRRAQDIIHFLPEVMGNGGRIIVTSRNKKGWDHQCHLVTVNSMEPDEAELLIESLLTNRQTDTIQQINQLSDVLKHNPLRIWQTCTHLSQQVECTIPSFISRYHSDKDVLFSESVSSDDDDNNKPKSIRFFHCGDLTIRVILLCRCANGRSLTIKCETVHTARSGIDGISSQMTSAQHELSLLSKKDRLRYDTNRLQFASNGSLRDYPTNALKGFSFIRTKGDELTLQLSSDGYTTAHHRAMCEVWKSFSESERMEYFHEEIHDFASKFSSSIGVHVSVITHDGYLLFGRRGSVAPTATHEYVCSIVGGVSAEETIPSAAASILAASFDLQANVTESLLRYQSLYTKWDTNETGVSAFIDLRGFGKRYALENFKKRLPPLIQSRLDDVLGIPLNPAEVAKFLLHEYQSPRHKGHNVMLMPASTTFVAIDVLNAMFDPEQVELSFSGEEWKSVTKQINDASFHRQQLY